MAIKGGQENSFAGAVEAIDPRSPAADSGLKPGDLVLTLNGHPLHDIIDYQFYLQDDNDNRINLERNGKAKNIKISLAGGGDPGISFAAAIFDRVRVCGNKCKFCFIDQLPRGLRSSLYLKDDDFRLSFLYGNFITLGNLKNEDFARILKQRLSPLYVSVHATDPAVRAAIMGTTEEDATAGLELLRRLGEAGIRTHIQVVLCPGVNDARVLEQTVRDLAYGYKEISSIGVVPAALGQEFLMRKQAQESTKIDNICKKMRPVTAADCKKVISQVSSWQERFRKERGSGFVYAADEFYLKAGQPLPPVEAYDDFPQYENGIGIAASFSDDAKDFIGGVIADKKADKVFLVTGLLAADVMSEICHNLAKSLDRDIRSLIVENRTFGPHVTVAGLLGGKDIIKAAQNAGVGAGDAIILPRFCLDGGDEPRFIDNVTLERMQSELSCAIL